MADSQSSEICIPDPASTLNPLDLLPRNGRSESQSRDAAPPGKSDEKGDVKPIEQPIEQLIQRASGQLWRLVKAAV
jgi:hypothetical protein